MTDTKANKPNEFSFEQSLEQLEQLVAKMESGELALEESLQAFEQGIKLTRQCQEALTQAEQRVHLLLEQNNASSAQPFAPNDADELPF